MKYGIKGYIKYKLFSRHSRGHGIHSPFVFEFITNVLRAKGNKKDLELAGALLWVMSSEKKTLNRMAFGATGKAGPVKVGDFVKRSSVSRKYGKLLYNIVSFYKAETILELGTAAGISAVYMALANPGSKLVSVEGCRETAMLAQDNLNRTGVKNATVVNASFEEVLPLVFFDLRKIDVAFFDGNHTFDATVSYFEKCFPYAAENSVFIFDDIHWSQEMEEAWEMIKSHHAVSISIDLYRIGIVFFRKGIEKQHFVIRY